MGIRVVPLAGCAIIVGQGTVSLVLEFGTERQPLSAEEFTAVVATAMTESRLAGISPVMMTEEEASE